MNSFSKSVLLLLVVLVLSLGTALPVRAHGGTPGELWQHWGWQDLPWLLLIGGLYVLGLQTLWARAGTGSGISRGRAAAFGAAWLVLFVAIISPLDALSEELFTAHMVQHLLLMLVSAPLFVIGRFQLAFTWVFPARWTSTVWKKWGGRQTWRFLTRPVTACLLHAAAIWVWHLPRLYEAGLRDEWLHFLEHASFFLTAWLFWHVFMDLTEYVRTGGSAKFGIGIFMVFSIMLISGFLGALLTFSQYVWYPIHIHETALYGLTALEDQQLAGTIMWVPSGVVYLVAVIGVMGRWLFGMEALERPSI
jgi:putative membrane protein